MILSLRVWALCISISEYECFTVLMQNSTLLHFMSIMHKLFKFIEKYKFNTSWKGPESNSRRRAGSPSKVARDQLLWASSQRVRRLAPAGQSPVLTGARDQLPWTCAVTWKNKGPSFRKREKEGDKRHFKLMKGFHFNEWHRMMKPNKQRGRWTERPRKGAPRTVRCLRFVGRVFF